MKPILKIEQIRLANLQSLVIEFGTACEVAKISNTSRVYLSQLMTGALTRGNKVRTIGTELARKLEKGCGKPEGWMDINHQDLDSDEMELQKLYAAMDDNMRNLLIEQARLILRIKS